MTAAPGSLFPLLMQPHFSFHCWKPDRLWNNQYLESTVSLVSKESLLYVQHQNQQNFQWGKSLQVAARKRLKWEKKEKSLQKVRCWKELCTVRQIWKGKARSYGKICASLSKVDFWCWVSKGEELNSPSSHGGRGGLWGRGMSLCSVVWKLLLAALKFYWLLSRPWALQSGKLQSPYCQLSKKRFFVGIVFAKMAKEEQMSPLPPDIPSSIAQCRWSGALNPALVLLPGLFFSVLRTRISILTGFIDSPWLKASSPFMLLQPGPLLALGKGNTSWKQCNQRAYVENFHSQAQLSHLCIAKAVPGRAFCSVGHFSFFIPISKLPPRQLLPQQWTQEENRSVQGPATAHLCERAPAKGRGIYNRQEFQPSWALQWQWSPVE